MTEEQIKEAISRSFVHLVASRGGYKCGDILLDHGVDLQIRKAVTRLQNGRTRYLDDGRSIDVQLKSTTQSQVQATSEVLKYDLETKSYNDLVYRRNSGSLIPLILILLVLPDDPNDWVAVSPEQLVVKRAAYWYRPLDGAELTENTSTKRIDVPKNNVVDLEFLGNLFQQVYQ